MNSAFRRCKVLLELDTTNWDTGKVTNASCMFYECLKLQRLETGNWDVSSVTDMSGIASLWSTWMLQTGAPKSAPI